MDVCHSVPSFLENIDGVKLIYILTSISFAIVFIFIAVLNRFTVLAKLGLPNGETPKFPLGNLGDVVFQNTALFFILWKFYNKFKRKGRKIGAFYAFLKPCIVPVDAYVFDQLLKNESASADPVFNLDILRKYFESEKYKTIENLLVNQLQSGENPKFDEIIQNYIIGNINNLLSSREDEENELKSLLTLSAYSNNYSGFRKHFSQFYFGNKNSPNGLTKKLEQIQLDRKKNDIKCNDFINALIKYLNKCSKEQSKEVLFDFVNTLSDIINYSLSTVYFCLNELHLNPEIQQELIDEIRRFKKDNNEKDFDKLLNFKYLNTVIKETLRKYPPCGYLLKKINSPFTYTENDKEIQLPANLIVLFSIFGLHHNSEHYTNPKEFDPDRFSEENEKFINEDKYLPLGKPNKNCANEHAIIIFFVKLIVMTILSTYKVKISKKGLPYLDYDPTKISPCPEMPFLFYLEPISEISN